MREYMVIFGRNRYTGASWHTEAENKRDALLDAIKNVSEENDINYSEIHVIDSEEDDEPYYMLD